MHDFDALEHKNGVTPRLINSSLYEDSVTYQKTPFPPLHVGGQS